jgi:hypothetical protein
MEPRPEIGLEARRAVRATKTRRKLPEIRREPIAVLAVVEAPAPGAPWSRGWPVVIPPVASSFDNGAAQEAAERISEFGNRQLAVTVTVGAGEGGCGPGVVLHLVDDPVAVGVEAAEAARRVGPRGRLLRRRRDGDGKRAQERSSGN